jgi:beta-glucosidase
MSTGTSKLGIIRRQLPAAAIAVERTDEHALERREAFRTRKASGPIGLLFIGDSITRRWVEAPDIWEKYFGRYNPANFGVGGEATQNLLWRLENGELDGISPRVVVLLIGTNNAPEGGRARDIAIAVERIVKIIREKLPRTRILIQGIYPRGLRRGEEGYNREAARITRVIKAANRRIKKLADGDIVRYAYFGDLFLDDKGRVRADILPDRLHLNAAGYAVLAPALAPIVDEMMAAPPIA